MTKEELLAQINLLDTAAAILPEPEKTIARSDISVLRIRLSGMALDEVAAVMSKLTAPDIADMKVRIAAVNNVNSAQATRVDLFNRVLGTLISVIV